MTFVVEEDEAFDPVDIGFLSPWAVMPGADCLADLVKELWLWRDWWRRDVHGRLSTPTDHFKSVVNQTSYFGILHGDLLARLESGERKEPDPLLRQSNPSDRESGWGNFHVPFCPTYLLNLQSLKVEAHRRREEVAFGLELPDSLFAKP